MIIDCDSCVMRQIACSDCVVSVLLDLKPAPGRKAELSNADEAAINNLSLVGLVPPLDSVVRLHLLQGVQKVVPS